ncbi:MAG TPA: pilin [Candidatus Absconditabacterales bacterium]|nr:pilin [Candidatus Absconditabacterales bacterium]
MKKILIITILNGILLLGCSFGQTFELGNTSTILNTDVTDAINTDNGNGTIGDPIREGAYKVINAENPQNTNQVIGGIVNNNSEITTHDTALNKTLEIIKNIINYALGLVSLVALVYLIIHGFMIITAAGDDSKYKKGLKGVKYAAIAIAGIGLSWFIVSMIFRIIKGVTTNNNMISNQTQNINSSTYTP